MFNDSKSKYRTTRSVQLATTRNYMEKRRLGQTILQYQKECREIMKQLRDKQYSFLQAKYSHIVAMNNLQIIAKDDFHSGTKKFNELKSGQGRTLVSRPNANFKEEINGSGNSKGIEKHWSSKTERIYRKQKNKISLPPLTRKTSEENRNFDVNYVTTRLPPLDDIFRPEKGI